MNTNCPNCDRPDCAMGEGPYNKKAHSDCMANTVAWRDRCLKVEEIVKELRADAIEFADWCKSRGPLPSYRHNNSRRLGNLDASFASLKAENRHLREQIGTTLVERVRVAWGDDGIFAAPYMREWRVYHRDGQQLVPWCFGSSELEALQMAMAKAPKPVPAAVAPRGDLAVPVEVPHG